MTTYPHRKNCDGTFDSICPECFRTIATVWNEIELGAEEETHRCDAGRMEELRRNRAFRERMGVSRVTEADTPFLVRDAA
jgi:hypothetical protein